MYTLLHCVAIGLMHVSPQIGTFKRLQRAISQAHFPGFLVNLNVEGLTAFNEYEY
jgi:hypothetical protein